MYVDHCSCAGACLLVSHRHAYEVSVQSFRLHLEKNLKTARDERYRSEDDEFHRLKRSDGLAALRLGLWKKKICRVRRYSGEEIECWVF
jgi:hypothetical protein